MFYLLVFAAVAALLWRLSGGSGRLELRSRVVEDFEARLRPPRPDGPMRMARGKAEREQRADGSAEFELWCIAVRRDSGIARIPPGDCVEILLGDRVLASVPVKGGRIRLKLRTSDGQDVPTVHAGTPVAIRYQGIVLLEGAFEPD